MDGGRVMRGACCVAAVAGAMYLLKKRMERQQEGKAEDAASKRSSQVSELSQLDAVGGHGSKKDKGPPILMRGAQILKPFQPAQPGKGKSRGELEADFYAQVTRDNHPIKEFIPKYFGQEKVGDAMYLKMENLTHGMREPCVLDLKMGQQTYDETASAAKIERERQKYPPQEAIGFRIVGMKVYRPSIGQVWKSSREWCMGITAETMQNAIEQFFFDGRVVRHSVVEEVIKRLSEIEAMLIKYPTWRMYGSSLLVVYEGAAGAPPQVRVRMIDFAHIFEISDGGKDAGYLHGLTFLKHCLQVTMGKITASSNMAQVGGAHGNIASHGGELVKKEDKPEQFDDEVAFYRRAWETQPPDALTRFMPRLLRVNEEVSPRELVISDATMLVRDEGANPELEPVSVMDVKLGLRSFRSDCPNTPKSAYFSKYAAFEQDLSPGRAEEIWKQITGSRNGPASLGQGKLGKRDYLAFRDATTTSMELAFRLTALVHNEYRVSQADSRSIETRIQFLERLEHFLYNENGFNGAVASAFVKQLKSIRAAIDESKLFAEHELVGTSLLFLHCNGRAAIRWIDFANSTTPGVEDNNGIVEGVHRLTMAIEELIAKYH